MVKRVCIQPCLGINEALSTIGRQASYAAYMKLGAQRADLGCAPALYAGVEEDVEFISGDWVIAVEACEKCCAGTLVAQKGGCAHATIRVDEVLAAAGFQPDSLPREHAPVDHPAVVAVSEQILRVAALLGGDEA